MFGILKSFVVTLCMLSILGFIQIARGIETEELRSNIIADRETPDEELGLRSEEVTSSDYSTPETKSQDTDLSFTTFENVTLEQKFENGVEAYLDDDWEKCIEKFENAIESYKKYKADLIGCRRKCREESNTAKPLFAVDIEDFHFYEKKVRETLCLIKCKKITHAKDVKAKIIPENVEMKYIERRPYEYLHICYYQMQRHQDAANAIYTFLTYHPKHEQSLKNLRFYVNLPDVIQDQIIDLESDPFLSSFKAGTEAYNNENYHEVIIQLENSIKAYIKAEDDCRFYCEGSFDQGWHPDFVMSTANHFAFSMKCKRKCSDWLNNVNGEQRYGVLMDHYHYLQFAYFKIGKFKEACAAVESYLYFIPDDETVLKNKDYFLGLPEVKRKYFTPREEVVSYVNRQEYERRILLYIQEEFNAVANSS